MTFDESKQYAFRAHIIYSVSLFGLIHYYLGMSASITSLDTSHVNENLDDSVISISVNANSRQ